MQSIELRRQKLAQSSLVIAPRAQWELLWKEVAQFAHLSDRWSVDGWEKAPTIAQLKSLHQHVHHTPVRDIKLAAIPYADTLSRETANSLLKILEEPPSYFWTVLFAESENVLPTIASRVRIIRIEGGGERTLTPREHIAQRLHTFNLLEPTDRARAQELLYSVPLIHSTIQLPVIEEGFSTTL